MRLRLTNLKTGGANAITLWSFDPLFDNSKKPDFLILRKSGRNGSAGILSKPLAEQTVLRITFGVDCLMIPENYENFKRFLRGHKIEVSTFVAGKEIFTEFSLMIDEAIDMDHLEEHEELVFKEFRIAETKARWYDSWYKI